MVNKKRGKNVKTREKEKEAEKEVELDIEPKEPSTPEAVVVNAMDDELDVIYPEYKMIVDESFEAKNNHEECEDILIAKGYDSDTYGEYLDAKYSKKSDKDGSDFLDDGVMNKEDEDTAIEFDKAAKLEFELHNKLDAEIKATKEIEEVEKDKDQLDKSFPMPGQTHDHSKETVNPKPVKYREAAPTGGGQVGYTIWHCPECDSACKQEKHKWVCTSSTCLYGKPKPLSVDQIAEEITQYKLLLPDLGVSVHRVKMIHVGNGRYTIKEGQEKEIARQVIKILNNRTWKKLTVNQIEYLTKYDLSKGVV